MLAWKLHILGSLKICNIFHLTAECKHIFVISIMSKNWDGTGSWNHFPQKKRANLFYIFNTMCWCSGDGRSKGISSCGIDPIIQMSQTLADSPHIKPTMQSFHVLFAVALNKLLTHWGRVTHICVSKLTIIGSDNGLSPGRRQAIIWTNDGILLIGPLGTNFSEILIEIHTFSFKKLHLKTSSGIWRPFFAASMC